jgi:hypothetical protein
LLLLLLLLPASSERCLPKVWVVHGQPVGVKANMGLLLLLAEPAMLLLCRLLACSRPWRHGVLWCKARRCCSLVCCSTLAPTARLAAAGQKNRTQKARAVVSSHVLTTGQVWSWL